MMAKTDGPRPRVLSDLLFEEPDVGRCLVDADGKVLRANAEWLRATGYTHGDVVGADIVALFPETRELARKTHARARAGHRVEVPRHHQRVQGRDTVWEGSVVPVPMDGGTGLLITAREITARRDASRGEETAPERARHEQALRDYEARLEHERARLQAAHARLEEADRRRTEFLAMLSHELRNPLAPIRNGIYLLERAAPDSEQATRARQVVRRQAEHLTRLLDDLLDVTRISHGKIPLERGRVDLREIVRRTTDDLHASFLQAGIHLRVDHGAAGPIWIDADSTRVGQVLANLLDNAIKFTPGGGTVRVRVAARDGGAELCVADDGIGMDPARIEHMFEPFAQADNSLARTRGGLGLGLALVKSIVELHGGTIVARSDGLGRGAEFLVRIPLAGDGGSRDSDASAPRRTILVVDDDDDGAQSLADLLELHGHRVRIARDGRSGIALARELRPDVVLCDIGLPDLDGYDVARTLRRDGPRETRLVALSGFAQLEDRLRAKDAGFDAHLAKPVHPAELMTALERGR